MILNKPLIKTLLYVCLLLPQIVLANEMNQQCYSYLTELVRSSNFPFNEIPKENNSLLIDSDNGNVILAQVNYDKKDLGIPYDSSNTAINGWVKYYVDLQKLYNVSGDIDPDHPVEVSFDQKYADLFESCRKGVLNSYQDDCIEVNNRALSNQSLYLPSKEGKIGLSGRTYFYSAPNIKCKVSNELFIIKNDIVKVIGEFDNYYNVVYKKKSGDEVKGWVYKSNLISLQEDTNTPLDKAYSGDYLVSKKGFIETINESCSVNNI